MDFALKMMDFVSKMMDFVLKMMDFVLKMMDFVLKTMDFVLDHSCHSDHDGGVDLLAYAHKHSTPSIGNEVSVHGCI